MAGELGDAAAGYARRGLSVFPCRERGKQPLGALVPHGLHDATTDLDMVESWWSREPNANIGLRTGETFDVLDVDGPQGISALDGALPPADQDNTIDGPTVSTGGGGWHVYVAPTGLGNRAGFVPGCDWRGRGGYVVAPPSVHPSGQPYRWWVWDASEPIRPAPAWLLALLQERPASTTSPPPPVHGDTPYGQRALESELGRLATAAVGERNHQLVRASYRLGQLVAAGELPAELVVAQLLEVSDRIGLPERESVATIKSGMRAGMTRPREAPA